MLIVSVFWIRDPILRDIVAVADSPTVYELKKIVVPIISAGDNPPILLFELESIDFEREFSIVISNEPWGYVVGAVFIVLTLKLKVTGVDEATPT